MKKIFIILFMALSINTIAQVPGYKGKKSVIELQLTPHIKGDFIDSKAKLTVEPTLKFEYAYGRKHSVGFRFAYSNVIETYDRVLRINQNSWISTDLRYKAPVFHFGIENSTYKRKFNVFSLLFFLGVLNFMVPDNNWSLAPVGKFRTIGIYYNSIGTPSTEILKSSAPIPASKLPELDITGKSSFFQIGYTQGTRFVLKDKLTLHIGTRINIPIGANIPDNLTSNDAYRYSIRSAVVEKNILQFYAAVGFLR